MAWPYLPFSQRKQTANLYCVSEGANSKWPIISSAFLVVNIKSHIDFSGILGQF